MFRFVAVLIVAAGVLQCQTKIDLGAQTKNVDFSGALSTKPFQSGPSLPGTCAVGQMFFNSAAPAGANVYACTALNTWTLGSSIIPVFSWAEVPAGTVNGVNTVFTLAAAPNPAASLALHWNGILQKAGVDYTLSGATITFAGGLTVPQSGATLLANYQTGYSATNPTTCASNTVVAGPTSGPAAIPVCRALVAGDIPGGGGGGVWGFITGVFSAQTDLQNALNAKPTAALVLSVGTPGLDTNVPSEKAVRTAIGAGSSTYVAEFQFGLRNSSGVDIVLVNVPSLTGITCCDAVNDNGSALQFASGATGYIVMAAHLKNWNGGAIALDLWGQSYNSAGSGTVLYTAQTMCQASGSVPSSYNAAQSTNSYSAPNFGTNIFEMSIASLTLTGCAADNVLLVKIQRSGAGTDTHSAGLLRGTLTWSHT